MLVLAITMSDGTGCKHGASTIWSDETHDDLLP
jgi:hypothetical protein